MNTCNKCGDKTNYDSHLCESCYARRANHLHNIIRPQARQQPGRLLALGIAAFLLSLLFAALAYDYAHAAGLQMQILISGKPAVNIDYTLDWGGVSVPGRALLYGVTDENGMVKASNIQTGTMILRAACLVENVEVGEVQGQALQQVDASCLVWLPGVTK